MTVDTAEKLSWRAHPARERPLAAVACVVVIAALAGAVYGATESEAWALAAAVVLCLSMGRFFFPSRYEITAEGIEAWMPLFVHRRLRWGEVRRVEVGHWAAWVSPYTRRQWREARRGVHLLFGRKGGAVVERLRRTVPAAFEARATKDR